MKKEKEERRVGGKKIGKRPRVKVHSILISLFMSYQRVWSRPKTIFPRSSAQDDCIDPPETQTMAPAPKILAYVRIVVINRPTEYNRAKHSSRG